MTFDVLVSVLTDTAITSSHCVQAESACLYVLHYAHLVAIAYAKPVGNAEDDFVLKSRSRANIFSSAFNGACMFWCPKNAAR